MDAVELITAIASLVVSPHLGGGGMKSQQTFDMLMHLVALINGGRETAKELKEWSEEVKAMADNGVQPSQRDFDRWTSRLDAALAVIAQAEADLDAKEAEEVAAQAKKSADEAAAKAQAEADAKAKADADAKAEADAKAKADAKAAEEKNSEPEPPTAAKSKPKK